MNHLPRAWTGAYPERTPRRRKRLRRRSRPTAAVIATLSVAALGSFGCQEQRQPQKPPAGPVPESLSFQVNSIAGEPVSLARYFGKVVVVGNSASR